MLTDKAWQFIYNLVCIVMVVLLMVFICMGYFDYISRMGLQGVVKWMD